MTNNGGDWETARNHCLTNGARGEIMRYETLRDKPFTSHIEDLQVYIGNSSVRIGRYYIPLTATEFRILCTLMMQPKAVIRRAALLTAICEKNTHATARSLDVHISRLRTKMLSYGSWIRTVKGVGYRFLPLISAEIVSQPNDLQNAVNS